MEAPYDDMLLVCEIIVQIARVDFTVLWLDGFDLHAERHQFHNLLHPYVHGSSPGKLDFFDFFFCARFQY